MTCRHDYKKFAGINLFAILLISLLILLGWQFNINALKQPIPGHYPMNPTSALTFAVCSIGLMGIVFKYRAKSQSLTTKISGLCIILIAGIGFLRWLNFFKEFPEQILLIDKNAFRAFADNPVYMAPNTAANFILAGIAFFFLNRKPKISQYAALLMALIALIALTGYMHNIPALYGTKGAAMAIASVICFLLLALAILFSQLNTGFMGIITRMNTGGRIARLLLPMCIIVPLLIDVLRLYGESIGLYSHSFGIALCSIVIILIFIYVTWRAIIFINRINYSLLSEISERKKAETGIENSKQFLTKILENVPEMIFVKEGKTFNYVNVNKAAEKIIGMSEKEMLGKNDYQLFPKDIAEFFRQKDLEVLNSRELALIEEEPIMTGDQQKWLRTKKLAILDDHGTPLYLLGISEDITEKRQQEQNIREFYKQLEQKVKERTEELSRSEKKYRAILENNADFISMIDSSLKIIYQSPSVVRITGFSLEDRQFKPLFDFTHPDDIPKIRDVYAQIIAHPGVPTFIKYRMLTSKGTYIWVEGMVNNLLEDENVRAIVANYRDVTDRVTHEEEREQLIRELTQNNKDLRQFSYIISHNLRAPVANLMGLLSIADEFKIEDPELDAIIKNMATATDFLNSTINDLIKVVNIKDHPSVFSEDIFLEQLLKKVMVQVSHLLDKISPAIRINFKDAPVIHSSKAYLESIFLNLLTNSLKYRVPERPLEITITSEDKGNYWQIIFQDNGSGIDIERYKERLFGLYQRFHQQPDGKGLGLYLVKSQMEALNGTIELQSQVGKGTTFLLKFAKNSQNQVG